MLAATILTAAYALAVGPDWIPDAPGKWRPIDVGGDGEHGGPRDLPQRTRKEMLTRVESLLGPFRAVMSDPKGVEVAPHRDLSHQLHLGGRLLSGGVWVQLFDIYRGRDGKPEPSGESGSSFFITVNDVNVLLGSPIAEDAAGSMYFAPEQSGHLKNYPVFGGQLVLVASNKDARPWRPVSRERYVKAVVAAMQRDRARFATLIEQLERELSALSPEQRAKPARTSLTSGFHDWQGFDTKYSRAVVEVNPDFFDFTRSRISFQMITLYAHVGSVEPRWVTERKLAIFRALDLDAYARLLDH
jgi:hypothetical protein